MSIATTPPRSATSISSSSSSVCVRRFSSSPNGRTFSRRLAAFGWIIRICTALVVGAAGPLLHAANARDLDTKDIKPAQFSRDYNILPSYILEISVFQEPDLKSTLRVSNEGTIALPLIGIVPVGGLTPQGAAQTLRDRLANGYLV